MDNYILLSIKPHHIAKIQTGEKRYELRRINPRRLFAGCRGLIYATYPVKQIVGSFEVGEIYERHLAELWALLQKDLGIDKNEFSNYFESCVRGTAIEIKNYKPFTNPIPRLDFIKIWGLVPPQSYRYISNNLFLDLLNYEEKIETTQENYKSLLDVKIKANEGDSVAQNYLGLSYNYGEGVPKHEKEAFKWYKKAAEQGNAKAQYNLGFCYYHGEGTPKNYREAVKWFRKGAEQDDSAAQRALGLCHYLGKGTYKCPAMAYYLLYISCHNDKYAKELLDALELEMTDEQIIDAKEKIDDWFNEWTEEEIKEWYEDAAEEAEERLEEWLQEYGYGYEYQ